ncbi:MAG: hypothetical protein ACOX2O_10155 [Bdellovibrionota bacterium]|jgi:hypothetical protein
MLLQLICDFAIKVIHQSQARVDALCRFCGGEDDILLGFNELYIQTVMFFALIQAVVLTSAIRSEKGIFRTVMFTIFIALFAFFPSIIIYSIPVTVIFIILTRKRIDA